MSRQFDESMEGCFNLYGENYRLVEPNNIDELVHALEVKTALEAYLRGLLHDEEPGEYDNLLQEQEEYIQEYIESLGEFDNSILIGNINFFLRKLNLRMGEFEQLIGVSAGYISRTAKEKSSKKLSIDIVYKIAKLFCVDIRTLLEVNMLIPNSNGELISKFLTKLCVQTIQNDITWKNHGGAMCYLDDMMKSTGLFTEEKEGIIYHCNDHMNPKYRFVLADDIYTCSAVVEGKELAMIGFSTNDMEDSYFLDFVFLTPHSEGKNKCYIVEKAFYSCDDKFGMISTRGGELMHYVQTQEMDAQISPNVRDIIVNYIK